MTKPARTQKKKERGNGQGSVYRRGNIWLAVVTVYVDGKRTVRKRSAPTKTKAEAAKRDLLNERDLGVRGAGNATVESYLTQWIEVTLPRRRNGGEPISENTISNYEISFRVHICPRIGKIRLNVLTPRDVEGMLQAMADDGKSGSTVMRARSVLSMALDRAVSHGEIQRNVAALADMPVTAPRAPKKSLTAEQAKAFVNALGPYRLQAAFIVQLHRGLRPGEVLGLLWEDIDLDARTLYVRQSLHRGTGGPKLGKTKTPKSKRKLDLPAATVTALRAHLDRQADEREAAGDMWQEFDLVFPTAVGTATDERFYRRSLKLATKAAGLGDNWTPNELRHSCMSLLSAGGVAMENLVDLAGHTNSRMIENVYRHQVAPSIEGGAATVDSMFGEASEEAAA